MNSILKNTLILFAITFAAGLGLGFVYNVTLDARAKQEEKTKLAAYESVMPGMKNFENIKIDGNCSKYIQNKVNANEKAENISPIKPFHAVINQVVQAKDKNDKKLGYIVTVTDNEAYDGSLQMTVGVKDDGTVAGISFLALSETPGLGMKADEDSFKSQFKDKKVDYFVYKKSDVEEKNEIQAISSATITSNAVTHGVNAAIYCVQYITGGGR